MIRFLQKPGDLHGKVKIATVLLPFPEGGIHGFGGRGHDEDIIVGDAFDAPVLGAQGKGLADGGLPDKLFIQFSDDGVRLQVPQAKIPPIRDHPAGHIEGEQGPFPGGHGIVQSIDGNPRPEFPDPGVRKPPPQHVEHQVKLRPFKRLIGGACFQLGVEGIHVPHLNADHGNNDLCQDI